MKLQESEPVSELVTAPRLSAALGLVDTHHAGDSGALGMDGHAESASVIWRESIRRRLLGVADVAAACLALVTVLGVTPSNGLLALPIGMVVILGLFKVGGLYDRDDLRVVHSTLDETPTLVQLTGLFALGVGTTISMLASHELQAVQITILWIVSFAAIFAARTLARAVAGRAAPNERCLVIGETERVDRVRQKLAASSARAKVVAALPLLTSDVEDGDWLA
ncbi:MAG: hypothetical protein WBQ18_21340, partial [Solirubrobacteraceae bacterium]